MTIIEEKYAELLKEVDLHTLDSISGVLAFSKLTKENVKNSKIVQRKMLKNGSYSELLPYLVKVNKNGDYDLPDDIKDRFDVKSDRDVIESKDYKEFIKVFKNRDVKGIIDNFLNTAFESDETLQKRLIGFKAVHIF